MNDFDRWIDTDGPEPDDWRALLDTAEDVPDMSPERWARMDRKVRAAVAEQERAFARGRRWRRGLSAGLVAVCCASVVALSHAFGPHAPSARRAVAPETTAVEATPSARPHALP